MALLLLPHHAQGQGARVAIAVSLAVRQAVDCLAATADVESLVVEEAVESLAVYQAVRSTSVAV